MVSQYRAAGGEAMDVPLNKGYTPGAGTHHGLLARSVPWDDSCLLGTAQQGQQHSPLQPYLVGPEGRQQIIKMISRCPCKTKGFADPAPYAQRMLTLTSMYVSGEEGGRSAAMQPTKEPAALAATDGPAPGSAATGHRYAYPALLERDGGLPGGRYKRGYGYTPGKKPYNVQLQLRDVRTVCPVSRVHPCMLVDGIHLQCCTAPYSAIHE